MSEQPATREFRGVTYCIREHPNGAEGDFEGCALPHPEYPGYFDDKERTLTLFQLERNSGGESTEGE